MLVKGSCEVGNGSYVSVNNLTNYYPDQTKNRAPELEAEPDHLQPEPSHDHESLRMPF